MEFTCNVCPPVLPFVGSFKARYDLEIIRVLWRELIEWRQFISEFEFITVGDAERVEEKCCNAGFGRKTGRKETAVKNEAWLAKSYRQRAAGCRIDSSGLVVDLVGNSCGNCPKCSEFYHL